MVEDDSKLDVEGIITEELDLDTEDSTVDTVEDDSKLDVEGIITEELYLDPEAMVEQFAENFIDNTFGELNAMAKQTVNTAFSYVLAVFLFAFQIINKEQPLSSFEILTNSSLTTEEKISSLTNSTTAAFTTNAFVFDERTKVPFFIACGCAAYGFILSMMVLYKARNSSITEGFNSSKISKLYAFTDKIPIIDSILEIPVALSQEFWITIFLWAASLTVSLALLFAVVWDGKGIGSTPESAIEGALDTAIGRFGVLSPADLVTELYSNIYAGYLLLFRLTGDVSQFYVLEQAHKKFEIEKIVNAWNSMILVRVLDNIQVGRNDVWVVYEDERINPEKLPLAGIMRTMEQKDKDWTLVERKRRKKMNERVRATRG